MLKGDIHLRETPLEEMKALLKGLYRLRDYTAEDPSPQAERAIKELEDLIKRLEDAQQNKRQAVLHHLPPYFRRLPRRPISAWPVLGAKRWPCTISSQASKKPGDSRK